MQNISQSAQAEKDANLQTTVPTSLKRVVDQACKRSGTSLKDFVARALRSEIERVAAADPVIALALQHPSA
jgi:hypothetical protein